MIWRRPVATPAGSSLAVPHETARRGPFLALARLDVVFICAVAAVGLIARLWYARAIAFPPLDDPAYYLRVAQNLLEGRGFTVDIVWNYFLLPQSVTHPSNEYWMPLTSIVISAFYHLFGLSFQVAQIPGLIAGTAIPVMSYVYARRVFAAVTLPTPQRAALACGMLASLNALLTYQAAVPDSPALFAALVLGALLVAGARVGEGSAIRHCALGILMGLAYLTRSHAIFLVAAWCLLWLLVLRRGVGRRVVLGRGLAALGGLIAVVGPWLARNYLAFGVVSSPSTLKAALIFDYLDFFSYTAPVDLGTFFANGWKAIVASRWAGLAHNFGVENVALLPTSLLGWAGLVWLAFKEPRVRLALGFGTALFLGMALVYPVPSECGGYYHSLGAFLPALFVGLVYLLARCASRLRAWRGWQYDFFELLWVGFLALALVQLAVGALGTAERHRREAAQFAAIAGWLDDHPAPAVITTQPSTLNYRTGVPAIMLPGNERPESVLAAARRFDARYLIITERYGLYPAVLEELPDDRFVERWRTEQTVVYELRY